MPSVVMVWLKCSLINNLLFLYIEISKGNQSLEAVTPSKSRDWIKIIVGQHCLRGTLLAQTALVNTLKIC